MGLYSVLDSADIQKQFISSLEAGMEDQWGLRVAYMNGNSDRAVENYNWLGQPPAMSAWVGNRSESFFNKFALTIANTTFQTSVPVNINDFRRDKTGHIPLRLGQLATRANTHWNSLAATLINNGAAATTALAYDGQYFFDTDHNESGSNQTNNLTATEIPSANVTTTSAPTATEAANILTEAIGYFQTLTDDQGEPFNTSVKNVTIVCPRHTIKSAFQTAARASMIPNLVSGASNPVLGLDQNFEVLYSPRLTAADAVYMFVTDDPIYRPFIFQEEGGVELSQLAEGSDEAYKYDRYLFGVRANRGYGYGGWQKALKITLS